MVAQAQSHPSWWNWASPDATALVGVRWETVRAAPVSEALAEELGPDGSLGLPDLELLKQAKQLLLSSPSFLVVASGDFPAEQLRAQASAQSMKPTAYKGVDLWISPGKSTLSVARISDHILLAAFRRNLEAAIDRNQAQQNQGQGERRYSPLLKRAARFSGQDLWVIATQLPDPLASRFVPLDVEARGFEGSVSLEDGIRLEGTLAAGSQDDASLLTAKLHQLTSGLPSIARGLQVVQAGDMVVLTMAATREQVAANLRPASKTATAAAQPVPSPHGEAAPAPVVAATAAAKPVATANAVPTPVTVSASAPTPVTTATPAPSPVTASVSAAPVAASPAAPTPVAALTPAPIVPVQAGLRVVRILGLDEGTREITLPPLGR
jgi:hypothetical protein